MFRHAVRKVRMWTSFFFVFLRQVFWVVTFDLVFSLSIYTLFPSLQKAPFHCLFLNDWNCRSSPRGPKLCSPTRLQLQYPAAAVESVCPKGIIITGFSGSQSLENLLPWTKCHLFSWQLLLCIQIKGFVYFPSGLQSLRHQKSV